MSRTTTLKTFLNGHCSVPKPFCSQSCEVPTWMLLAGGEKKEKIMSHLQPILLSTPGIERPWKWVPHIFRTGKGQAEECQSTVVVPGNTNTETQKLLVEFYFLKEMWMKKGSAAGTRVGAKCCHLPHLHAYFGCRLSSFRKGLVWKWKMAMKNSTMKVRAFCS